MASHAILRISKELSEIQRSNNLSLAVACREVDVRHVTALIVGPPDTPYEFGFFEFRVKFNREYPIKAPTVTATTTNGGATRFNPNIYAEGKVCLSILGTWRGERGEEWSSSQCLESILISIQSLMSSNPYTNEPGFESSEGDAEKQDHINYANKVRHETLRISVITRLEKYLGLLPNGEEILSLSNPVNTTNGSDTDDEPPSPAPYEPFKDLYKRRFLWYYESYLTAIEKGKRETPDQTPFVIAPFEHSGNQMGGKFNYSELERRLKKIKEYIDKETEGWAAQGKQSQKRMTLASDSMMRSFQQVVDEFKAQTQVTLDISLVEDNPFVWDLTYFGRPMTNLDGGLFKIFIYFSPHFPEEQPRVKFQTKMFHHRIALDGTLCYFPKNDSSPKSHVEGIIAALEDEEPPYDPRTLVNLETSKLYWGGEAGRRTYHRLLRRAVQRSTE